MDYTSASRKRTVEEVSVAHLKRGDPLFPTFADIGRAVDECWMVFTSIRDGLSRKASYTEIYETEEEANQAAQVARGYTQSNSGIAAEDLPTLRPYIEGLIDDGGQFLRLGNIGDEESQQAFDILFESGLREQLGGASQKVLEFLGPERLQSLQQVFGENWCSAAVFEYCWLVLPHSSAAFAAAAYQFHWYISGDELSAGYFWRDMEVAASGAEAVATSAIEMRKKAGSIGRERGMAERCNR